MHKELCRPGSFTEDVQVVGKNFVELVPHSRAVLEPPHLSMNQHFISAAVAATAAANDVS